jgi:hypothetical protein
MSKSARWKLFCKGFFQGLIIDCGIYLLLIAVGYASGDWKFNSMPHVTFTILLSLLSLFIVSYPITKYHQPKSWMLASLFVSIFTIPFLLGSIAVTTATK